MSTDTYQHDFREIDSQLFIYACKVCGLVVKRSDIESSRANQTKDDYLAECPGPDENFGIGAEPVCSRVKARPYKLSFAIHNVAKLVTHEEIPGLSDGRVPVEPDEKEKEMATDPNVDNLPQPGGETFVFPLSDRLNVQVNLSTGYLTANDIDVFIKYLQTMKEALLRDTTAQNVA